MEEWQEQLIKEAERNATKSLDRTMGDAEERCAKLMEVYRIKKRVVLALREEPLSLFGDLSIYMKTENHKLVHDVTKALGMKLERSAQADGFNFTGKYKDIPICVYGMSEVPGCKIVANKVMQEVTIYETVCNEEEKEK